MGLNKSKTLSAAKKSLDKEFSRFIRTRDASPSGFCKCVTCEGTFHWTQLDSGHFVGRRHHAVRWDERNAHAQCVTCNRSKSGMPFLHGTALNLIHGAGTAEELEQLSRTIRKWSKDEVMELARDYKERADQKLKEIDEHLTCEQQPFANDKNYPGENSNDDY